MEVSLEDILGLRNGMRPASVTHCTTYNTKHLQMTSTLEDIEGSVFYCIVKLSQFILWLHFVTTENRLPPHTKLLSHDGTPLQCISSVWVVHEGGWGEKMFKNQFHRKHRQIHLYTVINKICSIYVYKFKIWKGWVRQRWNERLVQWMTMSVPGSSLNINLYSSHLQTPPY